MLAAEPREFAKAVIQLVRDIELRRHIEVGARALAERGFSWRAASDRLEEAVATAVRGSTNLKVEAH
jgi:glycosyltransferase involved in cell wall biosynthesis